MNEKRHLRERIMHCQVLIQFFEKMKGTQREKEQEGDFYQRQNPVTQEERMYFEFPMSLNILSSLSTCNIPT